MTDIFGPHAQALQFRAQRNEVLATNLANADTPGFKARDVEFSTVMQSVQGSAAAGLKTTHAGHIDNQGSNAWSTEDLGYRVPTQPSLDGNTVETDVEQAQFAENVIQYRASLQFVNGKINTLRHALTGER